jgi:hypothetical protein
MDKSKELVPLSNWFRYPRGARATPIHVNRHAAQLAGAVPNVSKGQTCSPSYDKACETSHSNHCQDHHKKIQQKSQAC